MSEIRTNVQFVERKSTSPFNNGKKIFLKGLNITRAVGGCFRSVLQRQAQTDWNPANGSWWIVQILSEAPIVVESDPNHPPTSVGGIWKVQRPWVVERI